MENAIEKLKVELKDLDFEHAEQIKNKDFDKLIHNMIQHIGSTDPELRDKLIYTTFFYLIQRDFLNHNQMTYLMETCLDDKHLFLNIGMTEDDSVFTRAFSSLVIALILDKDSKDRFLTQDTALKAIESSITYLQQENDTRGYVQNKGWAHSIAHGADLLDEAIKHPLFDLSLTDSCLETIGMILLKEVSYRDEEDERLIFAIEALLDKGMDESLIDKWILNLNTILTEIRDQEGFSITFFRKKVNYSNFLKTLYFRLMFRDSGIKTRKSIEGILAKWHQR